MAQALSRTDPSDRPYFKKSETFHQPDEEHQVKHKSIFDPGQHGTEGPLQTTYSVTYGASHQHWHATLHKLGIETNSSHFSGSNVGVWTSLTGVTPDKRERSYSATAYYRPNSGRKNLHLFTEALVQEVVLEKEDGQWVAKGVRFIHEGKEHVIRTEGEVILCAGSVQSPQLLELSGIGNPEVLKAAGIDAKIDNPAVGENLQDHMSKFLRRTVEFLVLYADRFNSDRNDLRDLSLNRHTRRPTCRSKAGRSSRSRICHFTVRSSHRHSLISRLPSLLPFRPTRRTRLPRQFPPLPIHSPIKTQRPHPRRQTLSGQEPRPNRMELRRQQLQPLFQIAAGKEVRHHVANAPIPFLERKHTPSPHEPENRHQGDRRRQTGHRPQILRRGRRGSRFQNDGRVPSLRRQNLLHLPALRHHPLPRLPARRPHGPELQLRRLGPRVHDHGLAPRRHLCDGRQGERGWVCCGWQTEGLRHERIEGVRCECHAFAYQCASAGDYLCDWGEGGCDY